ncbi:MAG: formylglycine-generating enzyme family protein, partial [Anaerolineae bacterium]|nr:formylglycine-generating enzyme family protein [Anaerolineae bacterium]
RADFLGEVAPFKSLKDEVENHQVIIPPMDEAELRRSMEAQAACAGLRFESDLSQQMLDDVSGEPGAMPLLQHALWTLWTRRHGRWLRAEEYRAFGGVRQAIASTAEAVFARCTDFERERLRDIFLRLTRLDESADGRDTRRRVLLRDLIPADSDPASTTLLVKQLADARLVIVTSDEVEVAHEALIRHWERLRAWLNDDRDNLRLREDVSDDARRWENAARDESLLNHRGPRLELALAMSKNPRYRLNPVEQAYLDGCNRLKGRYIREKRLGLFTVVGISLTALILISISITLAVTGQWNRITHPPLPMMWVEIPAGEFIMGSSPEDLVAVRQLCPWCDVLDHEQPQHTVFLDTYQIGKYEVTNQQYAQCVKAKVCSPREDMFFADAKFSNYPVASITWQDAQTFCQWVGGRLPTEAEWEKAARGPKDQPGGYRIYPWGNAWDAHFANVAQPNGNIMPVGSYSLQGDGFYGVADMAGNVWEWNQDWYAKNYYSNTSQINPTGPSTGTNYVIRGSSYKYEQISAEVFARTASRNYYAPGQADPEIGFRCVIGSTP